jgi:DNA-binding NarL/FixJ family response regulator
MSAGSRLRVLIEPADDDLARRLAAYGQVVAAPPADVALLALDGEIDDDAVDAAASLSERAGAPVVAIVDGDLPPRRARALAARAGGVVERGRLDQALEPTLRAVVAGQAVLPAALQYSLERPALSNREKQILAMVVLGSSNAEIADKLVVTESTVKNHLSSAFTKLGVRSRTAASRLILDPQTGLGLGVLRLSDDDGAPVD